MGRQREVRHMRKMKQLELEAKCDPVRMQSLREKFVNQVKKYFGVPYARKYWPKDSPEYNAPLFLDCCALVRKAVRDLSKDFGFYLGAWNQAYQYDTLPITIEREEDMQPGDLVFMSGVYQNTKSKKQRHNMTHVEIWLGDGEKVIGSRWNNGKVQVFDSYRFDPKSFHSEQYHFKSIDTWLMGICRSYCQKHPWRRFKHKPGRKSVFNPDEEFINAEPDDSAVDLVQTQSSSEVDHGTEHLLSPLSPSEFRPGNSPHGEKDDEDEEQLSLSEFRQGNSPRDEKEDDEEDEDEEQLDGCSYSQDEHELLLTESHVQQNFPHFQATPDRKHKAELLDIESDSQQSVSHLMTPPERKSQYISDFNSHVQQRFDIPQGSSDSFSDSTGRGTVPQASLLRADINVEDRMPNGTQWDMGHNDGELIPIYERSCDMKPNNNLSNMMPNERFLDENSSLRLNLGRNSTELDTEQFVDAELVDSGIASSVSTSGYTMELSGLSSPNGSEVNMKSSDVSNTCLAAELPCRSSPHSSETRMMTSVSNTAGISNETRMMTSVSNTAAISNETRMMTSVSNTSAISNEVNSKISTTSDACKKTKLPYLSSTHSSEVSTRPSSASRNVTRLSCHSCPDFSQITTKQSSSRDTFHTAERSCQSACSNEITSESDDVLSAKVSFSCAPQSRKMTAVKTSEYGNNHSTKMSGVKHMNVITVVQANVVEDG